MTGRFRFGKISTGMRVIARVEPSATPSTMTTTLIGLLSAARSSHIARDLPGACRVPPAGRDQDRLGRRKQKPNSARRLAVPVHRRFPTPPVSSAPLRLRQLSPSPPDILSAPAFPFGVPLRVPQASLPPPAALRPRMLAPFEVVRSGRVPLAHIAPLALVHSPPESPVSDEWRKHRATETLSSTLLPNSRDRFPSHLCLQRMSRLCLRRCPVHRRPPES